MNRGLYSLKKKYAVYKEVALSCKEVKDSECLTVAGKKHIFFANDKKHSFSN